MAVGKRLGVLLLLTLSFACVPATQAVASGPVAAFTISPEPAEVGSAVSFDGSASTGTITTYAWKFGDGSEGTGEKPMHTYAQKGKYKIVLTVEDSEHHTAASEKPLEVRGIPQTITFTSSPPGNATVGGATYTPTATGGASGNAVTFTIDASSGSVCTIAGANVRFNGAGTCTIDANQAGNENYEAAPQVQQSFTVASAPSSSGGSSSSGSSSSNTQPPASTTAVITSTPPPPKGSFKAVSAMLHSPSYVITLDESLDEAGTLSWLVTFPNGPFGAYTAKNKKCRAGLIRLAGRCLPAKVLFGRGKQTFSAPGVVTITIKPTRAAKHAFKNAKRKHRNIKLTATLTFTSLRGGAPVVHTQVLTIKLAK